MPDIKDFFFKLPPKISEKPKGGEAPNLDALTVSDIIGKKIQDWEKEKEKLQKYLEKKKKERIKKLKEQKKKPKRRQSSKPQVKEVQHINPELWRLVFDLLSDPDNWGKTYEEIAKEAGVDVKIIEDTVKNNPQLQEALAELEIRRKLRYMQDRLPAVIEAMTEKALQGDPRAAAIIFRWLGIKEGSDKDEKKRDIIKISFYDPILYKVWGENMYQGKERELNKAKWKTRKIEEIIQQAEEINKEAEKQLHKEIKPPEPETEIKIDLQNEDTEVIELNEIKEKEGDEEGNEYIDIAKEGD